MPERTTTERLVRLVEQGEVINQACAALVLGVTRQRISQIVRKEGLSLGLAKGQPNTLIDWPCPNCGTKVEMWTNRRNARSSAYCTSCSHHFRSGRAFKGGRQARRCSVSSCDSPHRARGWCASHYYRWKGGFGSMGTPIQRRPRSEGACSADGCAEPHRAKGLCAAHYRQAAHLVNWERTVAERLGEPAHA